MYRKQLKIKDEVNLDILKKYGFKKVQQDKRINYIYMPVKEAYLNTGNSIIVFTDQNLFNMDRYIGEDRIIKFRFNEQATYDFNKTIIVFFNMIKDDIIEAV